MIIFNWTSRNKLQIQNILQTNLTLDPEYGYTYVACKTAPISSRPQHSCKQVGRSYIANSKLSFAWRMNNFEKKIYIPQYFILDQLYTHFTIHIPTIFLSKSHFFVHHFCHVWPDFVAHMDLERGAVITRWLMSSQITPHGVSFVSYNSDLYSSLDTAATHAISWSHSKTFSTYHCCF